jgi:hypothetical protein
MKIDNIKEEGTQDMEKPQKNEQNRNAKTKWKANPAD